jgi:hypothetical protein
MKFIGLVSGGKDSVFSVVRCQSYGHELVVLGNLHPPDEGTDELDSFMFQSAGHTAVGLLAECLGVPMVRLPLTGGSDCQGLHYEPTENDEVEDLWRLLREIKVSRRQSRCRDHPIADCGPPAGRCRSVFRRLREWPAGRCSLPINGRAWRTCVSGWGSSPLLTSGR